MPTSTTLQRKPTDIGIRSISRLSPVRTKAVLSGYKNHDDNPQEVNPWVIPQEKVFQVHTYQEELHDHACCPYQGGFQ